MPPEERRLKEPESYFDKNKNEREGDGDVENSRLTSCGIGAWRPAWLQKFASPVYFMWVMGLVGIIQGMTGPVFYGCSSTLEKRFGYDSKLTGLIMIMDNFAEIALNPFVGYLAIRFNRARLIAFGEVILACSCFMTAAPYFIYGPATHLLSFSEQSLSSQLRNTSSAHLSMCSPDAEPEECKGSGGTFAGSLGAEASSTSATIWPAVGFLLFGSFMRGLGYTCYIVIGLPYLDDNSKKKNTPMYISIMSSLRLIGPASGFMLASFSLRFYENPFIDPGIPRTDPRFIGAWWISFIVVGALLLVATLPMFLFPAQFKTASVQAKEVQRKIKEGGGSLGAFKRIVTNPLVMCCLFANSFRLFGIFGYIVYKSKYIEAQYRQSSSTASLITGAASFVPSAVGILLGGAALSYLKPRPRFVFILVFICEAVLIFSFISGFIYGCAPLAIDGHFEEGKAKGSTSSVFDEDNFSLASTCNANCHCSKSVYSPLCAADRRTTYFSPCHAGCKSYDSKFSTFSDCSCFNGQATKGYCEADISGCTGLKPYVTIITIGGIISNIARTPNALIQLRNVAPHDKAFAIGLATAALDIFAFIPTSIVFGFIIDSTCLIWETKCGKTGNCWVYDQEKFRNYLHGTALFCVAIASCFDFATIFMADRVKNFYNDDEKEEKEEEESSDGNGAKLRHLADQENGHIEAVLGSGDQENGSSAMKMIKLSS